VKPLPSELKKEENMRNYQSIKELVIDACVTEGKFPSEEKLAALVKKNFPDSAWQKTHYSWYKSQIKTGKIELPSNDVTPSKKDVIGKNVGKNRAIEFMIWKKDDLEHSGTYVKVAEVAKELREFLSKPSIQKEISQRHIHGAESGEIQKIFLEKLTELGFQSEKRGLFEEYSQGLRPDYYLPIDDTGIILEVERGKTTNNNMDILDLWKCHICKQARYLFLIVPKERMAKKGRSTKQFLPVSNRLKTFFEPNNYVNVDAVFLFGY